MADPKDHLLDLSKHGGLSLGTVAALCLALIVWVGSIAAGSARLSAQEAASAEAKTERTALQAKVAALELRVQRGEDKTDTILQAIGKLEATMKERTIYAKGRAE